MLSRQLEVSLRLAVSMARQKRHEFLTVEHLLLALLDNDSAVNALKACGADCYVAQRVGRICRAAYAKTWRK
jgi:ATP-dependent Clp protease ATP-binding subunit ClpA